MNGNSKYKLYGIPNCDTVKKVRVFLEENDVVYEFVDFKKIAPTKADIERWKTFMKSWPINSKGPTYRKIREQFESASDQEKVLLLLENSSAIKRPILEKDGAVLSIGKITSSDIAIPDSTAVRVALWRAMHVQIDSLPHVLEDEIGLKLVNPDTSWKQRPDMHPQGTRGYRASIVARARYIEDLVVEQLNRGVHQYVILGAGLDTFAQRRPEIASKLHIFEVDQPSTQEWKRRRLLEIGLAIPENLHFVPVNFEVGESWLRQLTANGFDATQPTIIASTGVAMYLTKEANLITLRQLATLAQGSILAMTFMLPAELIEDLDERSQYKMVQERARAAGTPFNSFFEPSEILALAAEAGFRKSQHVSTKDIIQRYFTGRADGLQPANGEEFLIATT
jgi:methyltransferase (TIGR00027 family)/Spx/MgsR family transcriptional regulator